MIFKLRQWCEGIIIAIIISVIIEMLIPDNKNKKYVKVMIGIYIMFASLNPILEMLNYDINFDDILKIDSSNTIQTSSNIYNDKIKRVYVLGIEEKIKEDIENLGYEVENVKVFVDSNYEMISKLEIKINGKLNLTSNIMNVEKVIIGNKKEEYKYEDIVSFLKEEYLLETGQVFIND